MLIFSCDRALWLAKALPSLTLWTIGLVLVPEPAVDNHWSIRTNASFSYVPAAPDGPSGLLQGVLLTLVMSLVLVALLVLVLWLRRTGQDGRWKERKAEEEGCYNEIRYTPSLMKRSFVWRPPGTEKPTLWYQMVNGLVGSSWTLVRAAELQLLTSAEGPSPDGRQKRTAQPAAVLF